MAGDSGERDVFEQDMLEEQVAEEAMTEEDSKGKDEPTVDLADLETTMTCSFGRNVLWRLLKNSGFFGDPYDQDPTAMATNVGTRRVGVALWNDMNDASPENVIKMMQENVDDR